MAAWPTGSSPWCCFAITLCKSGLQRPTEEPRVKEVNSTIHIAKAAGRADDCVRFAFEDVAAGYVHIDMSAKGGVPGRHPAGVDIPKVDREHGEALQVSRDDGCTTLAQANGSPGSSQATHCLRPPSGVTSRHGNHPGLSLRSCSIARCSARGWRVRRPRGRRHSCSSVPSRTWRTGCRRDVAQLFRGGRYLDTGRRARGRRARACCFGRCDHALAASDLSVWRRSRSISRISALGVPVRQRSARRAGADPPGAEAGRAAARERCSAAIR